MSNSISFTAAGIDVGQIVSGFIAVDRQPIDRLQARQATVKLQSDAVGRLRNSFESLRSAANGLMANGGVQRFSASVSSSTVVSANLATSGVSPGSLSFTVDRLARAHGIRTATTVASNTAAITTESSIAVSTTTTRVGLGSASVGAGVTAGKYTVNVTQATVGASKSGSSSLGPSTMITTGVNDVLDLEIDGVARQVTLAAGTYTAGELAGAVQTASSGRLTASLDGASRLRLVTTHEGSAATLRVMGGSALGVLGLTTDPTASQGTDGQVQIGTNAVATVTSAGAGGTVAVSTGTGNLTFDVSAGLRVGSATVAVVSTGDRSLTAVASAINGANVGATAAAVKVSEGNWLLQLSSKSTGVNGTIALDDAAFSGVGGLLQTSAAQDAQITVGSGPGAYSVRSQSNVFNDVMPGVTLTALTESATPVSVGVNMNDGLAADVVTNLVSSVNAVIADVALQTRFDAKTKKASPLTNDAGIRRLADEVRNAVTALVGDSSTGLASSIGIDVQRDGTLKFDRAKFITALNADPAAVDRFFNRGGSSTNGVGFGAATDKTVAGSYSVNVTTAPTRATSGDILMGGSVAGQRIGVRVGSLTATYDAAPGATAADIVSGLNDAMADAGIKVNAEVTGGGLRLTAVDYGGAGSFETNLDLTGAGTWSTNAGTDVAGTIDGKSAVGVGQRLRLLDSDTSPARGLEVNVDEGRSGALGPMTYAPGIAARLSSLVATVTGEGGALTSSARTYEARSTAFNEQITRYEDRLAIKEASYRRQWTQVQSLLNSMQTQQNWLTSQLQGLNGGRDG